MAVGTRDALNLPGSLRNRIMVAAALLLTLFFGLTFVVLDIGFSRAARQALDDVLDSQVLGLLAAADEGQAHDLILPPGLPETRFSRPGSGLYAQLSDVDGSVLWTSPSATGLQIPAVVSPEPGRRVYSEFQLEDGTRLTRISLRVDWEFDDLFTSGFVFSVASSMDAYHAQVSRYRKRIGWWFGLMTILLVAAQILVLRFLLRPLREAELEIGEIEAGRLDRLSKGYPAELEALASNINRLIDGERARSTRYRESLDNLAHSLKTPLAVVRSQTENSRDEEETDKTIQEQVDRMQGIVDYQLKRAVAGGISTGTASIDVVPVIEGTLSALAKVYADKSVSVASELDADCAYYGDRGDLTEILGNLLDNAFKWCTGRVFVTASSIAQEDRKRAGLALIIEDDGPGIDGGQADLLTKRGMRGDEAVPGQGIGLAVVRETVKAAGGKLEFCPSDLGGACVRITLPPT
ncbi:MAG: ATP-binding protein [Gammaproteobacteria bacterium]